LAGVRDYDSRVKFPADCFLYGILDLGYVMPADAPGIVRKMLAGGVDILQLRAKNAARGTICDVALELAPLCRDAGVPLILNDYPDLVRETGADGVHVGQDDVPVCEVRSIVGPEAIIGLSTHSLAHAVAAVEARPDYIGFGPLFATPTKPDYKAIGLDEIAEVHRRVPLPIFCIGGIKRENLGVVLAAGARRVVIVSGILQADDIAGYCKGCQGDLRNANV